MQSKSSYQSLTNHGCWERTNARSGGLQEWAMLEICAEHFCLATVHVEKRPSRVLPAVVVTPQEAAVGPKVRQTRQRLTHEDVVAIYLAKIGPKSSKTAARLAAEFGITGKAVRDVWRGKTWANQTRCMWTVQSAKDYISPAPSSTAAAARVKRALGRV
jgi:hypothetical protein